MSIVESGERLREAPVLADELGAACLTNMIATLRYVAGSETESKYRAMATLAPASLEVVYLLADAAEPTSVETEAGTRIDYRIGTYDGETVEFVERHAKDQDTGELSLEAAGVRRLGKNHPQFHSEALRVDSEAVNQRLTHKVEAVTAAREEREGVLKQAEQVVSDQVASAVRGAEQDRSQAERAHKERQAALTWRRDQLLAKFYDILAEPVEETRSLDGAVELCVRNEGGLEVTTYLVNGDKGLVTFRPAEGRNGPAGDIMDIGKDELLDAHYHLFANPRFTTAHEAKVFAKRGDADSTDWLTQ